MDEMSVCTLDDDEEPNDKLLRLNPGNLVRKKAVGIDLTEFEHLRRQLELNYEEQLADLRKQKDEGLNYVPYVRSGAFNSDKLKAM